MERKEHINRSIDYYNTRSDLFINSSVNADMASLYEIFESYIEPGSYILDLGCGSGRDSKYFTSKGYRVLAVDPSEEICKKAEELLKTEVRCIKAEELNYIDEFDAVWACASLLHANSAKTACRFR
ncbi:MAG: methyltransferase domain-containing protein [Clostridiales bacterium]|nr:methyltransferase domain-containing protein [Clostridiales bacterium]